MARPDPILYTPDLPSKERAFKALYAAGYTCGPVSCDHVIGQMKEDAGIGKYVYTSVSPRWGICIHQHVGSGLTLVNSLSHMIHYLKTHGAT